MLEINSLMIENRFLRLTLIENPSKFIGMCQFYPHGYMLPSIPSEVIYLRKLIDSPLFQQVQTCYEQLPS
jgi:hypothetical protein